MKSTIINIDDIIRARKKEVYSNGVKLGEVLLEWDKEDWQILSVFTKQLTGKVYYLGAYHTLKQDVGF